MTAFADPPPFRAIADLVREHALNRAGERALVQGNRSVTWAQLDAMMDRVAASLQRDGLEPRGTIAICAANCLEYAAVFLGALRAGVAVAPLQTGSLPAQMAGMVTDSGARHFFVDAAVPAFETQARRIFLDGSAQPSLQGWLEPAAAQPARVDIQPDWPFNIIYSSGTTGTPKGIVQSHAMRWMHVARAENSGYGPDSVTLIATSLCSNTTLVCFFPTIAKGGCVVLAAPKFDAGAYLALAQKVKATHTMLVPVQYQRIMALPEFERLRPVLVPHEVLHQRAVSRRAQGRHPEALAGRAGRVLRHDRGRRHLHPGGAQFPGQAAHGRQARRWPRHPPDR